MQKKIILLFVLGLVQYISTAQVKEFSEEPEKFIEELALIIDASSVDKKELEEQLLMFRENWQRTDKFTDDRRKEYIKLANLYLFKRAKASPHWLSYLTITNLFISKERVMSEFDEWMEGMTFIIKKKNIRYADSYCNTLIDIFNTSTLYKSITAEWKTDGLAFKVRFDEVPLVEFSETNLTCFTKGDSAVIFKTKGVLYPLENEWVGEGGKVNWTRAGYGESDVFARLSNYQISLKSSKYTADSVWFTNKVYYNEEMLGRLEEKILADVTPEKASYPRFESYNTFFEIKNIYPEIDYKGGFTMQGSKFIGSGNQFNDAFLFISRGDSIVMTCKSKLFVFRKDNISGRNTAVSIYLGQDSLYHPGLLFKYFVKNREVSLIRNDDPQSMSRSPYYNTYHKIDMDFEHLSWNLTKNEMKMGALQGSIVSKASFESANYFRESRYHELGMYDRVHPLIAIKKYVKEYGSEVLYAPDLAQFMQLPLSEVRHLCLNLTYNGIIEYDIETDRIKVKPRLYDYLKARVGKIDYDVINFDSEHDMIGLENAALDIRNLDLKLYGVARIAVSDSQNVIIYPRGRQLIVKKNRDFEFDGIIEAGLFTFFGQNFYFSYEDFKIDLQNIDSLKIKVVSRESDAYGMRGLMDIQNVIENITGDLLIDDPQNKSSVKNFPEYPIFNSKQASFVYYDYPYTQNGVYMRDSFYFAVDPYKVDSLNSFTTEGLNFDGEFVSADILPTFREKLTVQKDYSLGFTRTTGPDGYEIYKGKGQFYDTINLSNYGLIGKGTITYLNSTARSREFIFLPDSVNGLAYEYFIEEKKSSEGTEFPDVKAANVQVHWEPYYDSWKSSETDSAISMYGGMATLQGGTEFTPEGLHGWGKFRFGNAMLTSQTYHFKQQEVLADTSQFDLLTENDNLNEFAFKTSNVSSYVNFEEKRGTFKSNDDMTVVQFPKNKYICYLDRFSWDMVSEEIQLGGAGDEVVDGTPGPKFYSVHPDQDTLNFVAPIATYDLNNYVIKAEDVEYLYVADAIVYPGQEGKVTVQPNAIMDPLFEAKITADATKRYHEIYDATVHVKGRLDYTANGLYDFIDENKTKQTIQMKSVEVDSTEHTMATGAITEVDSFMISPNFAYQGKVTLRAMDKDLYYDGATKLTTTCDTMPMYWIAFKEKVDANNIYIPISAEPKDINNRRLYASMYITHDSTHIYSTFLGKRARFNDIPIISADGYLYLDQKANKYIIASKEKISMPERAGNILTFHKDYCNVFGEGALDLGVDLGQVKMETYGSISHNITMDKVNLETMLSLDFFFPEELLTTMADTINANLKLKGVNMARKVYANALTNALGDEEAHKTLTEIKLYGSMKRIPEVLKKTIVFNHLDLQWNTRSSSYRSIGNIGVGNILDRQVNKMVKGYVEITKKRTGDGISIYLELSKNDWYFFSYTREVMQAVSSDENFNIFIEELKDDKKKLKTSRKEARYSFYLSSETRKNIFIKKFTMDELEEEARENMDVPQSEGDPLLIPDSPVPSTDSIPSDGE